MSLGVRFIYEENQAARSGRLRILVALFPNTPDVWQREIETKCRDGSQKVSGIATSSVVVIVVVVVVASWAIFWGKLAIIKSRSGLVAKLTGYDTVQ